MLFLSVSLFSTLIWDKKAKMDRQNVDRCGESVSLCAAKPFRYIDVLTLLFHTHGANSSATMALVLSGR